MIKFFRKIPKKLVNKNKFRKRIIDIIGEIVLIVIGILIALWINNWSEGRKNNSLKKDYFNSIQAEFEYNKSNLKILMSKNNGIAHSSRKILEYTGPNISNITGENFDSLIVKSIGYEIKFRPKNKIIDALISSGDLSLIENLNLKVILSSWSEELKITKFQEEILSRYRFQLLDLYTKKINFRTTMYSAAKDLKITQSKFENNNSQLLQLQEFENLLVSYIASSKFAEERYETLERKIDEILCLVSQ